MENRNVIRFVFTKKKGLKYIAHLDLQRAVTRIIKRSNIPVRYTQGFNPHPKMVFGLPLSVGCESECELLDIYMVMDESRPNVPLYTPEEFKKAILPNLPDGLDFVDAYYPSLPFSLISTAVYSVSMEVDIDISKEIEKALSEPMIVFKKSKAGDRDVDISPMIRSYNVCFENGSLELVLELSAAQNNYLNPELVITGLRKIDSVNNALKYYTVNRTQILFNGQ